MFLRIRAGRARRPAAARRIAYAAAVAALALTACSTDNPMSLRPDVDVTSRTASLSGGGMRDLVPDDPYLQQAEANAAAEQPDVTYNFEVGPQPVVQGVDLYDGAYATGPAEDFSAPATDQATDDFTYPAAVDPEGAVDPYAVNPQLAATVMDGGVQDAPGDLYGSGAGPVAEPAPVDPYAVNPDLGRLGTEPVRTAALTRPVDPSRQAAPRYSQPQPSVMPAEEVDCRRELKRLGVTYVDLDPIDGGGSCGIDHPVKISAIGRVQMKPAATLRCEMAAAFAAWTKKELVPAARTRYFSGVKTIHQASSYSCRNIRRSKGVLSEHGKGNALDIARFELSNGRDIEVEKPGFFAWRTKGFLNSVRSDGCSYFTTVLGPGYDRDHKDHFHFDLKSRRSGYRACR